MRFLRYRKHRPKPQARCVAVKRTSQSAISVFSSPSFGRYRLGGVGLQTIRDWVLRFNAHGPAGLIDGKAPGNTSKLDDAQRQALAAIVERGPIPAIHEVVRWRLADLAHWIWEEFGVSLSETTVMGPWVMVSAGWYQ